MMRLLKLTPHCTHPAREGDKSGRQRAIGGFAGPGEKHAGFSMLEHCRGMTRAAERDRGAFSRWGDSSEFRATLRRTALNVLRALLVFSSLLAALGAPARSSEYPQRPVHLVVGLAAGGGTDIVARVVADLAVASPGPAIHRGKSHRDGRKPGGTGRHQCRT